MRYPGIPRSTAGVTSGFAPWLRLLHFLNLLFMTFIIRAGIQISGRPSAAVLEARLHARNRMVQVPEGRAHGANMDAKDDSVTLPAWLPTDLPMSWSPMFSFF